MPVIYQLEVIHAIRELKEELDIDVEPKDLKFIKTVKISSRYTDTFINNEFDDLYLLETDKKIEDMKYQESEVSEIMYVPYENFKEMVKNRQPDLLIHDDEFKIMFDLLDKKYSKLA